MIMLLVVLGGAIVATAIGMWRTAGRCPICGRKFDEADDLYLHFEIAHPEQMDG